MGSEPEAHHDHCACAYDHAEIMSALQRVEAYLARAEQCQQCQSSKSAQQKTLRDVASTVVRKIARESIKKTARRALTEPKGNTALWRFCTALTANASVITSRIGEDMGKIKTAELSHLPTSRARA